MPRRECLRCRCGESPAITVGLSCTAALDEGADQSLGLLTRPIGDSGELTAFAITGVVPSLCTLGLPADCRPKIESRGVKLEKILDHMEGDEASAEDAGSGEADTDTA